MRAHELGSVLETRLVSPTFPRLRGSNFFAARDNEPTRARGRDSCGTIAGDRKELLPSKRVLSAEAQLPLGSERPSPDITKRKKLNLTGVS